MGNFSCRGRRKGQPKEDEPEQESPKEDVLYATIDHGEPQQTRQQRDSVSDCDYAVVRLPCEMPKPSENLEDCTDDYVLMS